MYSKSIDLFGNIIEVGDYVAHISTLRGRSDEGSSGRGIVISVDTTGSRPIRVKDTLRQTQKYSPSTLKVSKKGVK